MFVIKDNVLFYQLCCFILSYIVDVELFRSSVAIFVAYVATDYSSIATCDTNVKTYLSTHYTSAATYDPYVEILRHM